MPISFVAAVKAAQAEANVEKTKRSNNKETFEKMRESRERAKIAAAEAKKEVLRLQALLCQSGASSAAIKHEIVVLHAQAVEENAVLRRVLCPTDIVVSSEHASIILSCADKLFVGDHTYVYV